MVRKRHREEFEQLGLDDVRKRVSVGMWDEDKQKNAREWIDEIEHGETRAYTREQLSIARDANEIARSASNAANAAADAARSQARTAKWALTIAMIALVISVAVPIKEAVTYFWSSASASVKR